MSDGDREKAAMTRGALDLARALAALPDGETRYRTIVENAGEGIVLALPDGRYFFANRRFSEMLGYEQGELLGKTSGELVFDGWQPAADEIRDALREGRVVSSELKLRRKDGTPIWTHCNVTPVFDERGAHVANLGLHTDVTERKSAEESLRASERRYRELVEHANSAIIRWRSDGVLTFFNEYAERLFGWSTEEVLGRHVNVLLPDANHDSSLSRLAQDIVADPEQYGNNVNLNMRKDGEVLWVSWTNHPLRDERGEVTEVLAVGNDVTDLVRAQAALRDKEAIEAAERERLRVARDLHDSVTQALFAATLKAEALTATPDLGPDVMEPLQELVRVSRGALSQMRLLLLELRGEPVEAVPIQQLLRNLAEATEGRCRTRVALTFEGESSLPPEVHATIYRVAQEALNNVVRHAGAANAWLHLRAAPAGVWFQVGDDGRGFAADMVEPGRYGLASMLERADEIGAEMDVSSAAGRGTAVTLTWPGGRDA